MGSTRRDVAVESKADMRPMIAEVVVVEGKSDVAAVKRACRAQTIMTSGLGISRETIEEIRLAQKHCGVIILTDPDAPGEKIRRIISQKVPGCKHAYLYRDRLDTKRPIGVEHAGPAEILAALEAAKATSREERAQAFTLADMVELGLAGETRARAKRDWLSRRLDLGQTNGKQFLRRLNDYGVSRDELLNALEEMEKEIE